MRQLPRSKGVSIRAESVCLQYENKAAHRCITEKRDRMKQGMLTEWWERLFTDWLHGLLLVVAGTALLLALLCCILLIS